MCTVCPKCAYTRGAEEVAPDYECPRCGVVYEKYRAAMARREKEEADAVAMAASTGQKKTQSDGFPGSDHDPAAPEPAAPAVVAGHEESPDAPAAGTSVPWLRYLALAAAFLLLIGVMSLSARQHGRESGRSAGVDRFAGVYEGSAAREIALTSGSPYVAEYDARFVVGQDGRVSEITWTDGARLLDQSTVSWSAPARIEYTIVVREDYTGSFEDPPRGEYSRFSRDGSSFRVEAVSPRGADLRRFEYSGEIPPQVVAKETAIDGLLRASKLEPGAYEAVIRPGLPRMGRRDAEPDDVSCEFAESAARRALQPYLTGAKSLPDGKSVDLEQPVDGVDIEDVMVPRWPGRLWVNLYAVRVDAASGALTAGSEGTNVRRPRVEPGENSRLVLDFCDPIGWEVRVVFLPDGRAVARIPARDIEIPVTKVEEAASAAN